MDGCPCEPGLVCKGVRVLRRASGSAVAGTYGAPAPALLLLPGIEPRRALAARPPCSLACSGVARTAMLAADARAVRRG
eukprot:6672802-Pyramimonas_sp.AAC.1